MIRPLGLACALLIAAMASDAAEQGGMAEAQHSGAMLRAAAQRLERAVSAADRVAALTAAIRAYEAGLGALREGLRQLDRDEAALSAAFASERARLSRFLGVLLALERVSPEMRLLHPSGPVGAVRAGMMVAELVPAVEGRAAALGERIERLRVLRALREAALDEMTAAHEALAGARADLASAIATRRAPVTDRAGRTAQLASLAQDAGTLEDFARLLGDGPSGDMYPAAVSAAPAAGEGGLPLPVAGRVLRGYGAADAAGIRRPGLVVAAEPRALVIAPVLGTLRYRGPLLDYGNVIILEIAPEHLLVLAGLDLLYDLPAGPIPPGTPLGLLPGEGVTPAEFLREAHHGDGASGQETLYIEIRHRGEPVDPLMWFATEKQQESQ